jgi:vacuolar protein sorting-associated protein 8
VYPNEKWMDEATATKAKAEIYWFLFCGKTIAWPKETGQEFLIQPGSESQPAFPYLRLILKFDAPSLLSALNEAFEDPFLNDSPEKQNGTSSFEMPEEQIFGQTINRQYIVSILLDVLNPTEFTPEQTIYLDMFIARNLPKFPQYLLFSGSTLSKVLTGLCNYPGEDLAEDAQLSAEYLLSVYHPSDIDSLLPLFKQAGFYRILKRIYRVEKQYRQLVETYFDDPEDQEAVFECIADCLRPHSGLNKRQVEDVLDVVQKHGRDLLELDSDQTAQILRLQDKNLHLRIMESAADSEELQHAYLKALLEPKDFADDSIARDRNLIERYVQLMCTFDAAHVSDYVGVVQSSNLRLEKLLPTMEETGVIDAAVVLMAQDGQIKEAMERLVKHLGTLESALQGLISGANEGKESLDFESAAQELLLGLQKYVYVGIWLCEGQMKTSRKTHVVSKKQASTSEVLSPDEALWLRLINACVQITRRLSPTITEMVTDRDDIEGEKLLSIVRSLVQHTFTSLLTATSGHAAGQPGSKLISTAGSNISFLRILRAFLTEAAASSPNLADLRGVLSSIFAAYAYEESILRLSNRLLERTLYVNVSQAVELRQRGWRPRGSTCEACGRRVWGPGVAGGSVFEAWEDKQVLEDARRRERKAKMMERATGSSADEATGKGKGKSLDTRPSSMLIESSNAVIPGADPATGPLGPLVVLACRHVYHQSCLDSLQDKQDAGRAGREGGYQCPVDGVK